MKLNYVSFCLISIVVLRKILFDEYLATNFDAKLSILMMVVSGYWLQIITPPSDHLIITLNVDANYFIVRMIFDYTLKLLEASVSNFNQRIVNYGIQI